MSGTSDIGGVAVETPIQIRWGDMDALGHVNNATYLAYLETAREPFFEAVAGRTQFTGFLFRRLEIDYRSPVVFEDGELRVAVALESIGTSSFTTRERMVAGSDGRLVAEARAVSVHLDESGTRSAPILEELRARLELFLAPPVAS